MLGRGILGHWDAHLMPHLHPRIWACPRDWNLQPLYLHYFLQCCTKEFTNLHTIKWGGPPTPPAQRAAAPSLVHAPPWHPLAAPATVGSSIKWSSQSSTVGHQR